jgi:ketosteroid isomerase-like protein
MPEPAGTSQSPNPGPRELLRRINQAWLEGRPADLTELFHRDIVMILPGFAGRVQGREQMVSGFVDFCANATVHAFEETQHQIDVIGRTAVASLAFAILYERDGQRFRSTGRDLWVFTFDGSEWLAVWRTMLDVTDEPAAP